MSIEEPSNRYSVIEDKNPREILLLRGRGCGWRRCTFCDYHLDYNLDENANYLCNEKELKKVTGVHRCLEVINSGSFCELDDRTIALVREICVAKNIPELHVEFHWMYRDQIEKMRRYFEEAGITLVVKMGVETFDHTFREAVMKKGIDTEDPREIANYADEVCLLFGLTGQTVESMGYDIKTGLQYFKRICINIMVENSTKIKPDPTVIRLFKKYYYDTYIHNPRVDILMSNTEFGVGDAYQPNS